MFMKKKFINGLLMAALSVATVGSFVACTDHEDDRLLELQEKILDDNAKLKDGLQSQIDDLYAKLQDLEAAKCTCGDIKSWVLQQLEEYAKITQLPTDYLTRDGALQLFYTKTEIDKKFYTKEEIDAKLAELGCECKDNFTKQDIIDIINQYLVTNNYITREDATTIINNLLQDYYTKTELNNLLQNYVTNDFLTQNFYDKTEVINLINQLTENFYTKEEINKLFSNYYTKEEVLKLINNGGLTAEQVQALIKIMLKEYYTKSEIITLLGNYYTKDEIEKMLAEIKPCDCNVLTIEEIMTLINVDNGGNYYNKTKIDEILEKYITQEAMVTYVTNEITKLENKITTIVNNMKFGDKQVTINQLVNDFYNLQIEVGTISKDLEDLTKRVETLEGYYEKYKELLENLQSTYESVYSWYLVWKDEIINIKSNAQYSYNWVTANEEMIKNLKETVDSLKKLPHGEGGSCGCDFSDLEQRIKDLEDALKDIKSCDCTGGDGCTCEDGCACGLDEQKVKDLIADALKDMDIDLSDYVTKKQMEDAIDAAKRELQDQIDDIVTKNEEQDTKIKVIEEKIKDMATVTYVNTYVKEQLAKLVTAVTVNATWSPVLGEGGAPVGLSLNVLAAYHGDALDEISFPDYGSQYLANPVEKVLTQEDLDILRKVGFSDDDYYEENAGHLYYGKDEGKKANAGKLYFTINPNTVDFTGLDDKLTVENSAGKVVPMALSNVKKSDHVLSWGYTRAGNNGFYEADAEIDPSRMDEMKARLDLGDMKDLALDLKNFRTEGFDVTKIITTIYEEAGNVLDRYAVAVNDDDRKVYSDYALAATTVRPLGFYSVPLESYKQDNVPGIGRVETFINDVKGKVLEALAKVLDKVDIDKIQDKIDSFDWSKFEVKDFDEDHALVNAVSAIKIDLMNTSDFNETVYVWQSDGLNGGSWVPAEIYGYAGEKYIYVKINLYWEFKRLYDDMADPINDGVKYIKDFLASKTFQDMLDLLAGLEDRVEGYADRAENFILKYLNKFNNRMVRYLDPNDYLKTVLLVKDGNAYTRVSMSPNMPTKSSNTTVKFLPTTFNADIISPCYKKFVAVTNVWKVSDPSKNAKAEDAETFAVLKDANSQDEVMEVTEGNKQVINFTGKAGYKYEILYSALDFNGKNMNKKYYIQF